MTTNNRKKLNIEIDITDSGKIGVETLLNNITHFMSVDSYISSIKCDNYSSDKKYSNLDNVYILSSRLKSNNNYFVNKVNGKFDFDAISTYEYKVEGGDEFNIKVCTDELFCISGVSSYINDNPDFHKELLSKLLERDSILYKVKVANEPFEVNEEYKTERYMVRIEGVKKYDDILKELRNEFLGERFLEYMSIVRSNISNLQIDELGIRTILVNDILDRIMEELNKDKVSAKSIMNCMFFINERMDIAIGSSDDNYRIYMKNLLDLLFTKTNSVQLNNAIFKYYKRSVRSMSDDFKLIYMKGLNIINDEEIEILSSDNVSKDIKNVVKYWVTLSNVFSSVILNSPSDVVIYNVTSWLYRNDYRYSLNENDHELFMRLLENRIRKNAYIQSISISYLPIFINNYKPGDEFIEKIKEILLSTIDDGIDIKRHTGEAIIYKGFSILIVNNKLGNNIVDSIDIFKGDLSKYKNIRKVIMEQKLSR